MSSRIETLSIVVVTILMCFSFSIQGAPPPEKDGLLVKLKGKAFHPTPGQEAPVPKGLARANPGKNKEGYYLVQFRGPVMQSWRAEVEGLGIELLEYIPDFAFKVRMTQKQAQEVRKLESVRWVGLFHPAFKLSPDLTRKGKRTYTLRLEHGCDPEEAVSEVTAAGGSVVSQNGRILRVEADSSLINRLAHIEHVAWMEDFELREKMNEYGAGAIVGTGMAVSLGFDGSTQTIAVADTGLGDGTAANAHSDINPARITGIFDWPGSSVGSCYNAFPDGPQDVDTGHGTHVAGTALGEGDVTGEARGAAPGAKLVFQAIEDYADMFGLCASNPSGYYLIGLPADLRSLYQEAYDSGARIHSNSWGRRTSGGYNIDSAFSDDFIWKNPEMTITFSAGNWGRDANQDGVVDAGSIAAPSTAKNVISVGASENDRQGNYPCDTALSYTNCASQGGQNNLVSYGASWPNDFPANPLRDDPTAGSQEQMAAFSGRGPTSDGRLKPDLVAPGTWMLSSYAEIYQQGYGATANPQNGEWQYDGWGHPANPQHKYLGGTSMASPLVAGAAAIVRDYFEKTYSHQASSAMVKALLINTAEDLLDENNDGINDNAFPIPNFHEGWGRIDLEKLSGLNLEFFENQTGLTTGQSSTQSFQFPDNAQVKFSLVWSDYPSSEAALINLVNDLDLKVTSPNGTVYLGNVFSEGWSQNQGSPDRLNNVENVYLRTVQSGVWTVQVTGYNVPSGYQPFALVVTSEESIYPAVSILQPSNDSQVSGSVLIEVHSQDLDGSVDDLTVQVSIDGGPFQATTFNPASGNYDYYWDTTATFDGIHSIVAQATNSTGATSVSPVLSVFVQNSPISLVITQPQADSVLFGEVLVQVNGNDTEDPAGSLFVEVGIDGANWAQAAYNPGSGLYEYSWDTTATTNGTHTIEARATNSRNDSNVSVPTIVQVSNSIPTVQVYSPSDGSTASGAVMVLVYATDANDPAGSLQVEVSVDGGSWLSASHNPSTGYYEYSWDTTVETDGSHTVEARATNSLGQTGYSVPNTVQVNNLPPSVSVVSPVAGSSVAGDLLIQVDASDPNHSEGTLTVRVRVDFSALQMAVYNATSGYYEYTWDSNQLTDGSHNVYATATDSSGKTGNAGPVAFQVDSQPPVVSITSPADGSQQSGNVVVQVYATDNSDPAGSLQVEVFLGSGEWMAAVYNSGTGYYEYAWDTPTGTDGSYLVEARATTSNSQTTYATPVTVKVNNLPPTVSIVSPVAGSTVSGDLLIQVDASDPNHTDGTLMVRIWVDFSAQQTTVYNAASGYYEYTWDSTQLADGSHTVYASATDSGAKTASATPVSFTVEQASSSFFVADLDGSSSSQGKNWLAHVEILLLTSDGALVSGAVVSGEWTGDGSTVQQSCTTDTSGVCSIASNSLSKKVKSLTFSVTQVEHPSLVHEPGLNSDPDGDSDGTSITVTR